MRKHVFLVNAVYLIILQLLTLLAISIVYLTYAIPIVYHNPDSGARATTGGFIIMIIMQVRSHYI